MLTTIKNLFRTAEAHEREVFLALAPVEIPRTFKISQGPISQIAWPVIDPDDDMQVLYLTKFKRGLIAHLGGRYQFFSVCEVRDFLKDFRISLTPDTLKSMAILEDLHCVQLGDMPPRLFAKLPHLINHVISGGQITHPMLSDQPCIDV